jgi:hypothetical protein
MAKEYRRSVELLGSVATVAEAIAYFKRHAQSEVAKKPIGDICDELVAAKTAN